MIRLLTTMCVLTVKSDSQIIVSQFRSSPGYPVLSLQPPPRELVPQFVAGPRYDDLQTPHPFAVQYLRNSDIGSDGNLPAVKENQPTEFFVPTTDNGHRSVSITSQRTGARDTDDGQNNSDVSDNLDYENKPVTKGYSNYNDNVSDKAGKEPIIPINTSNNSQDTAKVNVTEISFDERASFVGDKCPTGYIRINGSSECVQPD